MALPPGLEQYDLKDHDIRCLAMMHAIHHNRPDWVDPILQAGLRIDVPYKDQPQQYVINDIIRRNKPDVLKAVLEHCDEGTLQNALSITDSKPVDFEGRNMHMDARMHDAMTPLRLAAHEGRAAITPMIIGAMEKIWSDNKQFYNDALEYACGAAALRHEIDTGSIPSHQNPATPEEYAGTVAALISAGANPNLRHASETMRHVINTYYTLPRARIGNAGTGTSASWAKGRRPTAQIGMEPGKSLMALAALSPPCFERALEMGGDGNVATGARRPLDMYQKISADAEGEEYTPDYQSPYLRALDAKWKDAAAKGIDALGPLLITPQKKSTPMLLAMAGADRLPALVDALKAHQNGLVLLHEIAAALPPRYMGKSIEAGTAPPLRYISIDDRTKLARDTELLRVDSITANYVRANTRGDGV